jgi:nucleoside-diphosphate-sugar epimerase
MHALITGGAGFIGSHLLRSLLDQGHQVRVLDNLSSGSYARIADRAGQIDFVEADICDTAAVQAAMPGIEVVFHLAALVSVVESIEQPQQAYASNVMGTLNVLDAARAAGVRRVVQASSCAVYGNTEQLPVGEDVPPDPLSPYASSKLSAEQLGRLYSSLYELPTVALRFFNVYGPGQDPASPYAAVVPRFVNALVGGGQPKIFGDGLQSRDFIYVGDIVRGLELAATAAGLGGAIFNVGTGQSCSVLELAQQVGAALELPVQPQFLPPREGEVRHSRADMRRFAEHAGFQAQMPLAEGIAATVASFR